MNLRAALEASPYTIAVREHGTHDLIVSKDDGWPRMLAGTPETSYWYREVDSRGNVHQEKSGLTLAQVEADMPKKCWWPLRENGEWGEESLAPVAASTS